ncbi:MAG: inositol monophosphatase family protein, partial [Chlamydiota bacterium]|nr:inositol monophosphatase family protein [Chlamydiota bacterium]
MTTMKKNIQKTICIFLSLQLIQSPNTMTFASQNTKRVNQGWFEDINKSNFSPWIMVNPDDQKKNEDSQISLFIVRDLHADLEAQVNIASLIEEIQRKYNSKLLILTEGASGKTDVSFFGEFPDPVVRKKVSHDFVEKGWMTGPEYVNIARFDDIQMEIWGIEEPSLYSQNFKQFRNVLRRRSQLTQWFQELQKILSDLKKQVYLPELLVLDQKIVGREQGQISLEEYALYLDENFKIEAYPNIKQFCNVIKVRKNIDTVKLEKEMGDLIRLLGNQLNKHDLSNLVQQGLAYRLGKIQYITYLETLKRSALKASIPVQTSSPMLEKTIEIFHMQDQIDIGLLMQELTDCDQTLYKSFMSNPEIRQLYTINKYYLMLRKLTDLEMNREDLAFYESHVDQCSPDVMSHELDILLKQYRIEPRLLLSQSDDIQEVKHVIEMAAEFYTTARLRDQMLVNNALEKMRQSGIDQAMMITGGFHTEGMKQILNAKDINYIIGTPRVTHTPSTDVYLSRMLDERFDHQTIALPSLFNVLIDTLGPLVKGSLWQDLAQAYVRAWANAILSSSSGEDLSLNQERLSAQLDLWVGRKGSLTEQEQSIITLLRQGIQSRQQQEALSREQIESFVSISAMHAELTIQMLKRFYPDQQEDIAYADNLYRQLYEREPALKDEREKHDRIRTLTDWVHVWMIRPVRHLYRALYRIIRNKILYDQEGAYIQKGPLSKRLFRQQRAMIMENDITDQYRNRVVALLERAGRQTGLSNKTNEYIQERIQKLRSGKLKIYGFTSYAEHGEDYFMGHYDISDDALFVATDLMSEIGVRGPPTLNDEYFLHELLEPILTHEDAILLQQVLFPQHYPDLSKLGEQTPQKLYKGQLGDAIRYRINAKSAAIQHPMYKHVLNAFFRSDIPANDQKIRESLMQQSEIFELLGTADFAKVMDVFPWLTEYINASQIDTINELNTMAPDLVAHHQIRSAVICAIIFTQYKDDFDYPFDDPKRDGILIMLGALLQDVSKGVEPIKSVVEKGGALSIEERRLINQHGHMSVDALDERNAWQDLRQSGLLENDEDERVLKLLIAYHADLAGFEDIAPTLDPLTRDRTRFLLGFVKLGDSIDATNDRSRPYNMSRPKKPLERILKEESDPAYGALHGPARVMADPRAIASLRHLVQRKNNRYHAIERIFSFTATSYELYLEATRGIEIEKVLAIPKTFIKKVRGFFRELFYDVATGRLNGVKKHIALETALKLVDVIFPLMPKTRQEEVATHLVERIKVVSPLTLVWPHAPRLVSIAFFIVFTPVLILSNGWLISRFADLAMAAFMSGHVFQGIITILAAPVLLLINYLSIKAGELRSTSAVQRDVIFVRPFRWKNFTQGLIHEFVHRLQMDNMIEVDIPTASAFGALTRYHDEGVANRLFEEGLHLFETIKNPLKRWQHIAQSKDLKGKVKNYQSIFSARVGRIVLGMEPEPRWSNRVGSILAGIALAISQQTGNPDDAWEYLRQISKGIDPITAERLMLGADWSEIADGSVRSGIGPVQADLDLDLVAEFNTVMEDVSTDAAALLKERRGQVQVGYKGDLSVLTELDTEVQRNVFERILSKYPDHYIDGEEDLSATDIDPGLLERNRRNFGNADFVWVVDPIDGTRAYASSDTDEYSFAITLLYKGWPVLSHVVAPDLDEKFTANVLTGEARHNGQLLPPKEFKRSIPLVIAGSSTRHRHPLIGAFRRSGFDTDSRIRYSHIYHTARLALPGEDIADAMSGSLILRTFDSIPGSAFLFAAGLKTSRLDGSGF